MGASGLLAILLGAAALLSWRQAVPFAETVVITTALAIFGLALFPDRLMLQFALAAAAGYLVWVGLYLRRIRPDEQTLIEYLAADLAELALAYQRGLIATEVYRYHLRHFVAQFAKLGCQVVVQFGEEDPDDVRIQVSRVEGGRDHWTRSWCRQLRRPSRK